MLLLEPALFCLDMLLALKQACRVPLALFSVSGEYLRLRSEGDARLLVELFTMLKRSASSARSASTAASVAGSP
jgi:porphobilinogen synthase